MPVSCESAHRPTRPNSALWPPQLLPWGVDIICTSFWVEGEILDACRHPLLALHGGCRTRDRRSCVAWGWGSSCQRPQHISPIVVGLEAIGSTTRRRQPNHDVRRVRLQRVTGKKAVERTNLAERHMRFVVLVTDKPRRKPINTFQSRLGPGGEAGADDGMCMPPYVAEPQRGLQGECSISARTRLGKWSLLVHQLWARGALQTTQVDRWIPGYAEVPAMRSAICKMDLADASPATCCRYACV